MLRSTFPSQAGSSAQVVFHARHGKLTGGTNAAAVATTMERIRHLDHVVDAPDPLTTGSISKDGTIALATVKYGEAQNSLPSSTFDQLEAATRPATAAGLTVDFGGEIPRAATRPSLGATEAIGVLAAIVILLFAFGSVIAMGLPIGTALSASAPAFGDRVVASWIIPSTSTRRSRR